MSLHRKEEKHRLLKIEGIKWMILSQINLKNLLSEIKSSLTFHHQFPKAKLHKLSTLKESNEKYTKR